MTLPKSPLEDFAVTLTTQLSYYRNIVETIKDRQAVSPQFADQTCPDCKTKGMFAVHNSKIVNGKEIVQEVLCIACREVFDICQVCDDILGDDNRSDQDPEVCQACMDEGELKTWAEVVGV